jgi:hypothetical protein
MEAYTPNKQTNSIRAKEIEQQSFVFLRPLATGRTAHPTSTTNKYRVEKKMILEQAIAANSLKQPFIFFFD